MWGKSKILRYVEFKRQLEIYEVDVIRGKDSYSEFSRMVKMHLNFIFPNVKGFHRDHIVPKSFCRKVGISVVDTNNAKNLKYILPKDNTDKWSHLGPDELEHLKIMCGVWNIPFPSDEIISKHNESSEITKKNFGH